MHRICERLIRNGAGAAVSEIGRSNKQLIPDAPTGSTGDGMENSPSSTLMLLMRDMMHDSTSETRKAQLLEHQGYMGMKVLFLESHDDWSISGIRMAPRRKLQTRKAGAT